MASFDCTAADLDPRNGEYCHMADCQNDRVDLEKCIGCGLKFCELCISTIGDERYCEACGVCEFAACKGAAIVACKECGNLTCGDHLRKHPLKTECRQCNPRPDHGDKAA